MNITNARYETPLANPFAPQADTEIEVEHEPLFESASIQKSIFDWIKEKSPAIAIVAGNLLLMAGEYRVYHFAYESSGEAWKGLFAVLATFFPFVLWEILVQHSKANGIMRALAWAGIIISLGLGVLIGTADFIAVNGQTPNAEPLLAALAISLSLHAVFFLAYFYSHPDIKAHRLVAQALARQQLAEASAEVAESILKSARNRLELERRIAADYGYENLRRAIAEIEGRPYHAPKKSYAPRQQSPDLASALRFPDETVPAFGDNGHKSDETRTFASDLPRVDLRKVKRFKGGHDIKARQTNGDSRPLSQEEANQLLLQALGNLDKELPVHVANSEVDGKPAALAFLSGIHFEADEDGNLRLRKKEQDNDESNQ